MKHIQLFIVGIFSACFLSACNGTNEQGKNSSNASDKSQASASTVGKSSFSANLDGVNIGGGKIDDMQLQNTAFIYPTADNNGKKLLFYLYSNETGKDSYSFMFSVPDKTGTFTKNRHDEQPFDITLDFLGGDLSRYLAEPVTVNITSVTTSRVAGTFSGKFTLSSDTPNGTKKEVAVTDGKFDIPFSTGTLRPQ